MDSWASSENRKHVLQARGVQPAARYIKFVALDGKSISYLPEQPVSKKISHT